MAENQDSSPQALLDKAILRFEEATRMKEAHDMLRAAQMVLNFFEKLGDDPESLRVKAEFRKYVDRREDELARHLYPSRRV